LCPGAATVEVEADLEMGWLASHYRTSQRTLVSIFNLLAEPAAASIDLRYGRWVRLIATDEQRYGGTDSLSPPEIVNTAARPASIELAGHTAALYALEPN
jgi:hypothetical protein